MSEPTTKAGIKTNPLANLIKAKDLKHEDSEEIKVSSSGPWRGAEQEIHDEFIHGRFSLDKDIEPGNNTVASLSTLWLSGRIFGQGGHYTHGKNAWEKRKTNINGVGFAAGNSTETKKLRRAWLDELGEHAKKGWTKKAALAIDVASVVGLTVSSLGSLESELETIHTAVNYDADKKDLDLTYVADRETDNIARTINFQIDDSGELEVKKRGEYVDKSNSENIDKVVNKAASKVAGSESIFDDSAEAFEFLKQALEANLEDGSPENIKKLSHFITQFYVGVENQEDYTKAMKQIAKSLSYYEAKGKADIHEMSEALLAVLEQDEVKKETNEEELADGYVDDAGLISRLPNDADKLKVIEIIDAHLGQSKPLIMGVDIIVKAHNEGQIDAKALKRTREVLQNYIDETKESKQAALDINEQVEKIANIKDQLAFKGIQKTYAKMMLDKTSEILRSGNTEIQDILDSSDSNEDREIALTEFLSEKADTNPALKRAMQSIEEENLNEIISSLIKELN